jgi:hypothetical protein
MSDRLSVRMEIIGMDIQEILYLNIFRKSVKEVQVSLKYDKNNGHFTRRATFVTSRSILLRMRNVSNKKCRENQNT